MPEVTYHVALPFIASDDGVSVGFWRVHPARNH
jgi:hypothetical protein